MTRTRDDEIHTDYDDGTAPTPRGADAGEDRPVRAGGGSHRGVPQADAPVAHPPSVVTTGSGLLDQAELAARLGVSERFIRRLVSERRITYVKIGKQVRFDPADVDELIERSKVKVTPWRQHAGQGHAGGGR